MVVRSSLFTRLVIVLRVFACLAIVSAAAMPSHKRHPTQCTSMHWATLRLRGGIVCAKMADEDVPDRLERDPVLEVPTHSFKSSESCNARWRSSSLSSLSYTRITRTYTHASETPDIMDILTHLSISHPLAC